MSAVVNNIRVKTSSGMELDLSEVIGKTLTESGFVDKDPGYVLRESLEDVKKIDENTWETSTGVRLTRV